MRATLMLMATVALSACRVSTTPAENQSSSETRATEAAPTAKVTLARLDCGSLHIDEMDKSFAGGTGVYPPGPYELTDSCYLIRHGDQTMVWDTGLPDALVGHPYVEPGQTASMKRSLLDQLKTGGVDPASVSIVGISHYHADHTGQAHIFPNAKLLIGAADLAALKTKSDDSFMQMSQKQMAPWLTGGKPVEAVTGDMDVFGDGSVVMLDLPGHTPGSHSLMVKLKSGTMLLSGDLYHGAAARTKRGVPPFNTDKAQTLKSMDKFEALAKQTGAKVIIQHEPADIGKLPVFPKAAE
jgi:glyoxylase-like metal-dependent hydrolase (beta-lactamase superfamily II)